MAERVPRPEDVQEAAVVDDVDGPGVDHAQERDRPAVLGQDHLAARVELELGVDHELAELLRRERVKRRPQRQEPRDLAEAGFHS